MKSTSSRGARAARMASELVRESSPSRGETRGRSPRRAHAGAAAAGCPAPTPTTTTWSAAQRAPPARTPGVPHVDLVARRPGQVAVPRADARHRRHRVDPRPRRLGEVQVVLDQRVLRVVPAPGHALAAVQAPVARGPRAAEVRVGDLLARFSPPAPKKTPTSAVAEGVADAHLLGDVAHHLVRGRDARVGRGAEHPRGLVVGQVELVGPVGDVAPLRVVVERPPRAGRACWRRPASHRRRRHPRARGRRAAGSPGRCRSSGPTGPTGSRAAARRSRGSRGRRSGGPPRAPRPGTPSRPGAGRVTAPPKPEPTTRTS